MREVLEGEMGKNLLKEKAYEIVVGLNGGHVESQSCAVHLQMQWRYM